ncbi:MAG: hypothetical protein E5V25_08255 [Mesorhizobium sp.]|uniref:hypothetical protein n=1 Tax=Mesorhizobium sp. TaxID=1871066 RepID=UPI000FE80ECE|nr:hypothetical protein [Mesorhizobium sp.]RWC29815.1 MAG: hypothetical protein EOS70_23260 [Mesorhizobium sp.]TIX71477.1 MAG: hypothetical protein E5V25_08255 [Mesorhizobium sp.]
MITFQQPPALAPMTAAIMSQSIVDRMADKMLEMGMNGTAVTKESLFEHSDFTLEQIDQHGPEASNLARSRAVRNVA